MIVTITEVNILKNQVEHEKYKNDFYQDKIRKLDAEIIELKSDNKTLLKIIKDNNIDVGTDILNELSFETKVKLLSHK